MATKKESRTNLKRNNIAFYDSKCGRENITREVSSSDFIKSHFGIQIPLSSTIIEVGCGSASCLLSLKCRRRVGLDISHVNLTLAKKRSSNLMLVQADAEYIPFRRQVFDVLLIVDLLHHVPEPSIVFKEVGEIIRRGGHLFIWDACLNGVKPIYPLAIFLEKISGKMGNDIEHFGPSLNHVNESLEQNEFRIVREFGEGSFIRYLVGVLESFLTRAKLPFPYYVRRTLTMHACAIDKLFKGSPSKFGIMATKGLCT